MFLDIQFAMVRWMVKGERGKLYDILSQLVLRLAVLYNNNSTMQGHKIYLHEMSTIMLVPVFVGNTGCKQVVMLTKT